MKCEICQETIDDLLEHLNVKHPNVPAPPQPEPEPEPDDTQPPPPPDGGDKPPHP